MKRLENKVIIITGATGGIGLASAKLFAAEGARLVLVDLDQSALDRAVAEIGGDTLGVAADVANADATATYFDTAVQRFGRIDGAFLNAGIEGAIAPIEDYDLDMYDKVMAVNVRGVFLGLNGTVVKSHGGADATGIAAAVNLAFDLARHDFNHRLAARVALVAASEPQGADPAAVAAATASDAVEDQEGQTA